VRWVELGEGRALAATDTRCVADARPGVRQRIVTAAASQWEFFGYPVLDWSSPQAGVAPADPSAPVLSARLNPETPPERRRRAALRLGAMEDDFDVAAAIGAYWAVTEPSQIAHQNRIWDAEPRAGWAVAWSAAFVSWVMCEAGLPQSEFPRSSAHITYIEHAHRSAGSAESAYRYETNGHGGIEPGDLICAWRGTREPLDIETGRRRIDAALAFHALVPEEQERLIESGAAVTGPIGTHCDIVVHIDPAHGRLYAIGGNVVQAVTMSIIGFSTDNGRIRLDTPPEHPGAGNWFAVLRLNKLDAGPANLDAALQTSP
jgi:hypothetical protein